MIDPKERRAFRAMIAVCVVLAAMAWGLSHAYSAQRKGPPPPTDEQVRRCSVYLPAMKNKKLKRECLDLSKVLP